MEQNNKVFVDGLMFKLPRENAPSFVKGSIWIKVDQLKAWLDEHNTNNGGINIDIKESAKGNVYCELSTWKPTKPNLEKATEAAIEYPEEEFDVNDVPF